MSPIGVSVVATEVPQSAGVSASTGTVFIVAPAAYGPEAITKVRSLSEVVALYGPREGESVELFDLSNAFFSLGGETAYVVKGVEGSTAKAAFVELEATGKAKTLTCTAKYKGTYGSKLQYEVVENGGKTASKLVIYNPEGEVLEASPEYAKAEEILTWSEANSLYVTLTAGSNYSTGKSEVLKAASKAALSTGTAGVNSAYKEAAVKAGLEAISKTYGPGQVITANGGLSTAELEKVHLLVAEHCSKNNRFGLCDLKGAATEGTTVSELKTQKNTTTTIPTALGGYVQFFSTALKCVGATYGTTRTIAASGIVAGLYAKVAGTGVDNTAPAGRSWPLAPFVLGLTNTYTEAQINELNTGGITNFAERYGIICLYGSVTAVSQTKDAIFYQAATARERMRIDWELERVAENFLFSTLDGRHQVRSAFAGQLAAVGKRQWELNGLYGETANEAITVNVAEPVNTTATEQAGELNAEVAVRISPIAQYIKVVTTAVPITETII